MRPRRALFALLCAAIPGAPLWAQDEAPTPRKPPAKRSSSGTAHKLGALERKLDEQRSLLEAQRELLAGQERLIREQQAAIAAQQARLDAMAEQMAATDREITELRAQIPGAAAAKLLEERLRKIEVEAEKVPELPPTVVSAGDFPGSMRIPGSDAAIKFGGRVRTAAVFTLDGLGSEDRFLTNSIPVEPDDEAAGKGPRTTFSANTSRFNFDLRTPTGVGQMRAFLEGDFFGTDAGERRTTFRLRHAYAQFHGFLAGQTWSTFSDPAVNHQSLDFEGINGENLIRQALIRYTGSVGTKQSFAVAAETPAVSLTGGEGVNQIPDLVGQFRRTLLETGHLQAALVLRQIRGEQEGPEGTRSDQALGWGGSASGAIPIRYRDHVDRLLFQFNFGEGNARYINDLNSLGGQDAVFDPETGSLEPLSTAGWYLGYEHMWKSWKLAREMKLRSTLLWSLVRVRNRDFQLDDAYHRTQRLSGNLVLSPITRVDLGLEYIYGTRTNKNGHQGRSCQLQMVGIFRF